MQPVIVSVNVGRPIDIQNGTETWTSGIFKSAVVRTRAAGARRTSTAISRPICGFTAAPTRPYACIPPITMRIGASSSEFRSADRAGSAKIFRSRGRTKAPLSIGDTFRVGTAIVQVSQPRAPCSKLARRWNRLDMPKLVIGSGRTGWYLRVVEPGQVERGQNLTLIDRPFERWTIEAVNDVAYSRGGTPDDDAIRELSECPVLAEAWRGELQEDDAVIHFRGAEPLSCRRSGSLRVGSPRKIRHAARSCADDGRCHRRGRSTRPRYTWARSARRIPRADRRGAACHRR